MNDPQIPRTPSDRDAQTLSRCWDLIQASRDLLMRTAAAAGLRDRSGPNDKVMKDREAKG